MRFFESNDPIRDIYRGFLVGLFLLAILLLLFGCARYPYGYWYYRNNPHCNTIKHHK